MEKDEFLHLVNNNGYIHRVQRTDYPYQSDQELIRHYYEEHDGHWLGILLERYFHLIFGVCMKYLKNEAEAEDHTQQICLKVIKELHRHDVTYFKSWLYQVTKNHCLMHLRKNKHQVVSLEESDMPLPARPSGVAEAEQKEAQYQLLDGALASLNAAQQNCVRMFYYQRKSYQEIANELGYSIKQVKSFIQNGRRNMKLFIEKQDDGGAEGHI